MTDMSTVARPYARALFELAEGEGSLDAWAERLEFWAAVVSNPEMSQPLTDPSVTREQQVEMFEAVVADDNDDHGRNMIRLLVENDRLSFLPEVHELYESFRSDAQGEIEATVRTAFPLSDDQQAGIVASLSKRLERKVRLQIVIDKDLIGGAVIQAGDLVIDGSLSGRVEKMQHAVSS